MTCHILEYPITTPKRRQQHPRSNTKIRDEGQTIQVRIPPKRDRIPGIHHWTRRSQERPRQGTCHIGLDNPQENKANPMLPRILQLLLTIYRRIQQNSKTTICEDKEEMHRQLGMGKQRTTSIRRIKDKTYHSTSTGLLGAPRIDQNRNRRLEIRLLRNIVTTMPGRKMETSGVPMQANVGRRMQLQHAR